MGQRRSAHSVGPARRPLATSITAPLVGCALLLAAVGCSSDADRDGDDAVASTGAPTTASSTSTAPTASSVPVESTIAEPVVPETVEPETTVVDEPSFDAEAIVRTLASDEFAGRDDGTDGWQLAQEFLANELAAIAVPGFPEQAGLDGYLSAGSNVNVIGVIPGSELPDEYVVIGAHYDGLGDAATGASHCSMLDPSDTICNGAADNATGVAAALAVAHAVARSGPPRRSLLIAFWDREEDGLIGSTAYLVEPSVPVEQMVAYVNFDIQGANLLPSLRGTTLMVGAETGGPALIMAAQRAARASALDTLGLSLVFGQGRSDHAPFVGAGVPSVFFTDATNGCYHTTRDDMTTVDFGKLDQQILTAAALTHDLLATDDVPSFPAGTPLATHADAVTMLQLVQAGEADLDLFTSAEHTAYREYRAELERIVADGPDAFDDADIGILLGGAATLVDALDSTECDGHLTTAP